MSDKKRPIFSKNFNQFIETKTHLKKKSLKQSGWVLNQKENTTYEKTTTFKNRHEVKRQEEIFRWDSVKTLRNKKTQKKKRKAKTKMKENW